MDKVIEFMNGPWGRFIAKCIVMGFGVAMKRGLVDFDPVLFDHILTSDILTGGATALFASNFVGKAGTVSADTKVVPTEDKPAVNNTVG